MATTEKEMLTKLAIVMIDVDGAIGATLNPDAFHRLVAGGAYDTSKRWT